MSTVRNLQNVPAEPRIKKLFRPLEPDHVLVEADLSQAEGMVVAWYAQEITLINKYINHEDVHSFVGSIVLERPITKENKIERQMAKRIVHASNYGTSPNKITEIILNDMGVAISVKDAARAQNIYFQNFPRIRSGFQLGIQDELRKNNRVLKTPVGFERKFYSPIGDDLYRAAYAHYAQNIVAFITNNALNRLWDWQLGQYVLMQCHDAIVCSVPKELIKDFSHKLVTAMTYPVAIKGRELVIPVEVKTGENWGEMHETNGAL